MKGWLERVSTEDSYVAQHSSEGSWYIFIMFQMLHAHAKLQYKLRFDIFSPRI